MDEVGRVLWRSSGATPLLKQGNLKPVAKIVLFIHIYMRSRKDIILKFLIQHVLPKHILNLWILHKFEHVIVQSKNVR